MNLTLQQRMQIKAADAALAQAEKVLRQTPEATAVRAMRDARDALLEKLVDGNEIEAWCESCGLPFFDGDKYGTDEHGASGCLENGPCLVRPETRRD